MVRGCCAGYWSCFGGSSSIDVVDPFNTKRRDGESLEQRKLKCDTYLRLLTPGQQQEIRVAFKRFDADGNGTVDSSELSKMMREMALEPSEDDVKELMDSLDTNRDGKFEYEEFAAIVSRRLLIAEGRDEMDAAFTCFDINQDETLQTEEVRHLLTTVGDK